jgi:hypothetical protein
MKLVLSESAVEYTEEYMKNLRTVGLQNEIPPKYDVMLTVTLDPSVSSKLMKIIT